MRMFAEAVNACAGTLRMPCGKYVDKEESFGYCGPQVRILLPRPANRLISLSVILTNQT